MGKIIKIKGADFSENGFDIPIPFIPQFFQEIIDFYNENGGSYLINSPTSSAKYGSYGLVGNNVFNALNGLTVVGFKLKLIKQNYNETGRITIYHNAEGKKTLYEVITLQNTSEWQDVYLKTPKTILSDTDTFAFFVRLDSDNSNIDDIDNTCIEYYSSTNIEEDETGFLEGKKTTKIKYDTSGPKYSDLPTQINFIFPICIDLR